MDGLTIAVVLILVLSGLYLLYPWLLDRMAQNFRIPTNSIFGWLALKSMMKMNSYLESNAVKMCKLKPDDHVLEIGFGPGVGLKCAYDVVKGGEGKVFGIDTSEFMVEKAGELLKPAIEDKRVTLFHGSVASIPLDDSSLDCVFHCNCFYFWPEPEVAAKEIYRVMKPGSSMITTISLYRVNKAKDAGILKYGNPDVNAYMECLKKCGFENVHMETHKDLTTDTDLQVIFAEVYNKATE